MMTDESAVLTLRQAEELLIREWPGLSATGVAWLAYHQRAAELYAHIADVDRDHHHEALFLAAQERESARALTERAGDATPRGEDERR
jgi:hypothetical protein